jgi:hypothetical protein
VRASVGRQLSVGVSSLTTDGVFMNTTPIQNTQSKVSVGGMNVPHLQRALSKVAVGGMNVPHLKR